MMNSMAMCSTWRGMGSVRLYFAQDSPCDDNTQTYHTGSVTARSTRTSPSTVHQDGGVKYATGAPSKILGRDNITIGTWNTRTLVRAAGKRQELTHKMDRYRWNILGLSEMRWKNFGETTTEEGHKVFFSGKEDKHKHSVGFLVHKDIVNTVMGCHPVSSRLITIRLRAVPFNIKIVQAYAPTSDYDENKIEEFYYQLQNVIKDGYSCCTSRLECKSGQRCLWKLARHLWTLLQ